MADENLSRVALDELVEANLLVGPEDAEIERYSIHDLVRDMSGELLPTNSAEEILRVRKALLRAYRDRAVVCRKALEPDRPPHGPGFGLSPDDSALLAAIGKPERWLEEEKAALIRAVEEAYALDLDGIAIAIANSLPTYFIIRGTWNEWSTAYSIGILAADRCGDLVGKGYLLQGRANIERTMGQGTGAASLELSLDCFIEAGDQVGRAYVLNDIGLVRMYEGRWAEAEAALRESEDKLVANGHVLMALQPRRNRAISLMEKGETARAAVELEKVCELMARGGDTRWRAYSLADLAKAYRILGNPESAVARLHEAIEDMVRLGDYRWAAVTRIRLGDVYRSIEHLTEADGQYLEAGTLFKGLGDLLWGARVFVSRALVAIDQGHPREGIDLCVSGRKIFIMFGFREDECWSLVVQSKAEMLLGHADKAAASRESARQVARAIGRSDDLVDRFLDDSGPDVR